VLIYTENLVLAIGNRYRFITSNGKTLGLRPKPRKLLKKLDQNLNKPAHTRGFGVGPGDESPAALKGLLIFI